MTRNGKIARLPKEIRDQLNLRLVDGEFGQQLVQWLNDLPETKSILAKHFEGRPITEQNLSEWKQGAHQEWLRTQETSDRVQRLAEHTQDLDKAAAGSPISDRLSTVAAAELMDAIQKLDGIADPNERWRRLQEILRELSRLRSEDHQCGRLQMQQEQWQRKKYREDEEDEKRAETARKDHLESLLMDRHYHWPLMAKLFGGGEYGAKCVNWLYCVKHDLVLPELPKWEPPVPDSRAENQTQSDPVQPSPT